MGIDLQLLRKVIKLRRDSQLEHTHLWEQGVGGSNPFAPTNKERTYRFGDKSFLLLGNTMGSNRTYLL